jgi:hypothetical protein
LLKVNKCAAIFAFCLTKWNNGGFDLYNECMVSATVTDAPPEAEFAEATGTDASPEAELAEAAVTDASPEAEFAEATGK